MSEPEPPTENDADPPAEKDWLDEVVFRLATPRDIASCFEIEKASYAPDEAASRSSLQYRQHHAAPYFWCAVLGDDNESHVLGFVCATRCHVFDESSMTSVHERDGPLLAIHSVAVAEEYRRCGLATRMLCRYVEAIKSMNAGIEKLVLISKALLLSFYVKCGFSVIKPSEITHGQDMWFLAEMDVAPQKVGYPYWVVDSFAEHAGSGNPAAVVLLPSPDFDDSSNSEWMQRVGREFNLAETAFVWPRLEEEPRQDDEETDMSDEEGMEEKNLEIHYNIRYITCNGTEVDLCGHATLASAAILLHQRVRAANATVYFHASRDILRAERSKSPPRPSLTDSVVPPPVSSAVQISMDFPRKSLRDVTAPADRSAILSMLRSAFSMSDTAENIIFLGIDEDGGDIFIHVTTESFMQISHDNVNYRALLEWDGYSRGVIVCSKPYNDEEGNGEPDVDFYSRFFGPKAGIDEDPVTGSAHCTLGPYFSAKLEKEKVVGKQMSLRGGIVECLVTDDRVTITGSAVPTMEGTLSM